MSEAEPGRSWLLGRGHGVETEVEVEVEVEVGVGVEVEVAVPKHGRRWSDRETGNGKRLEG